MKDVGGIAARASSSELVEEVLVVEEETIERAVVALIEIEKTVAEGAGAAALAALLEHPAALRRQARRHPDLAAATSTAACSPRC